MTRVPVLDLRADAVNCDYETGSYVCTVRGHGRRDVLVVDHRLDGCPPLEALITSGKARFCVEVCSTSSFKSELHAADAGACSQRIDLDSGMFAHGAPQVLPGIVAFSGCDLPTDACTEPWRRLGGSLPAAAGQHLAHGQHINLQSARHSIISFVADPSMQRGHLRRRYVHVGQPRYEIGLHPDDLALCKAQERSPAAAAVMLASWTAVLADAARQQAFAGDELGRREPVGDQLAQMIRSEDPECPAPGEEGYDPLQVATLLHGNELVRFDDKDSEE